MCNLIAHAQYALIFFSLFEHKWVLVEVYKFKLNVFLIVLYFQASSLLY